MLVSLAWGEVSGWGLWSDVVTIEHCQHWHHLLFPQSNTWVRLLKGRWPGDSSGQLPPPQRRRGGHTLWKPGWLHLPHQGPVAWACRYFLGADDIFCSRSYVFPCKRGDSVNMQDFHRHPISKFRCS